MQDSLKNWPALGYFQRTDREMLYRERGVKQFIESGAVMGMGTDRGTPMNFHSEALWREIKVHVDMGMTPQRAIAAATRVNAADHRQGRELGTIEPGKLADVIVVDGNPMFDIVALSNVEIVVKDGTVFKGAPRHRVQPSDERGREMTAALSQLLGGALLVAAAAPSRAQPPTPAAGPAHPQGTNAGIFAFTGRCAGLSRHRQGRRDRPATR